MRVVIASDADGMSMKESIKEMLIADGHEVVDYSETPAADFVDSATAVAKDLLEHKDSQGFAFDKYGVGSYMAAVKIKGMVVANISDDPCRHAQQDGLTRATENSNFYLNL